jgi:hypothetical protein
MKIKALKNLTLSDGKAVKKDQTVEVSEEEGKKLIEQGQAEEAK